MAISRLTRPAVSVAAILAAQAAHAELTAQDVWDSWKDNMAIAVGDDLSIGGEAYVGGVLTVSDLVVAVDSGSDEVVMTIASMTFSENGDGSVSVTMSEDIPIVVTNRPWYGDETVVNMAMRHQGLDITVSGTPDAQSYALSADRVIYAIETVVEDDNQSDVSGTFALNTLGMNYTLTEGDLQALEFDMSVGSVDLMLSATDPWSDFSLEFSGQIQNLAADFVALVPTDPDLAPEEMFVNGLSFAGGYSFGRTGYLVDMSDWGADTLIAASVEGGATEFAFDAEGMGYSASAVGIAFELDGAEVPVPIAGSLAEYGLAFFMPLAATEEPAEFGFGLTIADLVIGDDLWSMVDPMGAFPRDPATLIVDLTGTAKLFYSIVDPMDMMMMGMGEVPGELVSLDLHDLVVAAAGAQLSGNGAFTFDNSDYFTFGGFPRPEGSVTLQVNGANKLLDTLAEMGLVPPDEVMGVRMMLGLFTVPVGDDQLTSTIEVNDQGHVIANGQRLQ